MDSLAATELSSSLRASTEVALSPTLLFEQPTARAIATHIVEELGDTQVAAPVAVMHVADGSETVGLSGGAVLLSAKRGRTGEYLYSLLHPVKKLDDLLAILSHC